MIKGLRNRPTETILALVILVVCGVVAYTQWRDPGPPAGAEYANGLSEISQLCRDMVVVSGGVSIRGALKRVPYSADE
ncbi:hypothetical protein J2T60_002303 [Natronospira proteinivora]|uniref:Uncharacterized protein n=1 Tax=Natronospira proteinivora TaxID=1807133 RepID=A0ABT1GDG7_9GAMM|nr:hypothetical protein [Natronospira proteinivora]MCP1728303.1 hypothetical protein [Natronospira proteinivora]